MGFSSAVCRCSMTNSSHGSYMKSTSNFRARKKKPASLAGTTPPIRPRPPAPIIPPRRQRRLPRVQNQLPNPVPQRILLRDRVRPRIPAQPFPQLRKHPATARRQPRRRRHLSPRQPFQPTTQARAPMSPKRWPKETDKMPAHKALPRRFLAPEMPRASRIAASTLPPRRSELSQFPCPRPPHHPAWKPVAYPVLNNLCLCKRPRR